MKILLFFPTFLALFQCIWAEQTDMGRCLSVFDISNRTIIKSTDSLNAGAKFLATVEHSKDRKDCEAECCQLPGCNIAIFHEKEDKDCYLFNCGKIDDFKCIFSVHDNYVAMGMMVDRTDLEKTKIHEQAKHELDLSMLKAKEDKPKPKPAAPSPSRDYYGQQNSPYNRYPDDSYGYSNEERKPRPDEQYYPNRPDYPNMAPSSQPDVAKPRRRPPPVNKPKAIMDKDISKPQSPFEIGQSRDCEQYQWQCMGGDQCIAEYDVCDGITQCRDKSDEDPEMCRELDRRQPAPKPQPTAWAEQQQKQESGLARKTGNPGEGVPHSHDQPPAGAPAVGASKTSEITKVIEVDRTKETTLKVERIDGGNTSLAALVLGLGMCLLAIFLVYVSCRLRHGRRRAAVRRSGKPVDNTEGEGLINGMYL